MAKKTVVVKQENNLANTPQMKWTDRTKKDLSRWKTALLEAENLYNPTRKSLYDLYADTILDPHLKSVMDKRILAVTNTKLCYKIEEKEDEEIENLIKTPFFQKCIEEILNSKFYGFSLLQIDLNNQTSDLIDRRYVKPESGIVVSWPYDETGVKFRESPYQNSVLEVGDNKDLGLLLIASQYVIFKKGNVSDWARFNERYTTPFRYVNLPRGATKGEISLAETQLKEMGGNGYGVFPEGSEMNFLESKSSGSNSNYHDFADFCNGEISKLFLGQTMTTENGSSMSQAKVHKEVEDKISRADKVFVEKILNTAFRKLMVAQGIISPEDKGAFSFSDEEEEMTMPEQLKMWIEASKIGKIDLHEFSEKFGVKFIGDETKQEEADEQQGKKEKKDQDATLNAKEQITLVSKIANLLGFFQ